jgi:hypothetical protein
MLSMELVYIVVFSFIALILLFMASYLLMVVLNQVSDHPEWTMVRESVPAGKESEFDQKDRP